MLNANEIKTYVDRSWEASILPTLAEYIRIPNKSPQFDPQWQANGHMDKAVQLLADWCLANAPKGMKLEIVRHGDRTPLLFIEVPGASNDTVLLYGHLDKQPEMKGWGPGLDPWTPVFRDGKLYGRGGADDGYAVFAALTAIKSLQEQNINHGRCVILIEACEESGSGDLPYYVEALAARIGEPDLIVCLDSGCANYEQLWLTTSLRGLAGGLLSIDVLTQGVHSGTGSGIVPSCVMVLRQLLGRIEDEHTGEIVLEELQVDIPAERVKQAELTAEILKYELFESLPFVAGARPVSPDPVKLILNRNWRPALSLTGSEGLPAPENAGNVTLPSMKLKLSMRLAPTSDAKKAAETIKNTLEKEPPFGAKVHFKITESESGWNAPAEHPWLSAAVEKASSNYFGKTAMYMGEGGSIPFMGMLGKKFPRAQFMITGVLGPGSNAHGPDEFLHINAAKNLTCCVAEVIASHFLQ
jgi:acetylornithine deacetylase/succinyl-diaminopimelate desuccinylase-like protein